MRQKDTAQARQPHFGQKSAEGAPRPRGGKKQAGRGKVAQKKETKDSSGQLSGPRKDTRHIFERHRPGIWECGDGKA